MSPGAPGAAQTARLTRSSSQAPRHFLSVLDRSADEWLALINRAGALKHVRPIGGPHPALLSGRTLALIFQKPSLRTRVSFEVAMLQAGGHALYLSPAEIQLGQREGIADAARVLSRYVDAIAARVYLHRDVEALARDATVPVINALSDREHPCQALADLLTLTEHRGSLRGLRLAYVGDGNNVASSLALAATRLGVQVTIASPDGFEVPPEVLEAAHEGAGLGGTVETFRNPRDAVRGADVVYTDAWYSMGQEDEAEVRQPLFRAYQVNQTLLHSADPNVLVMHDLPAHRGQEITDDVMDGPHSIIYDQAENRLHAQKALLVDLLERRASV
ncbi:MAG: ornithine carbamoyltransferase [Chloroflexi bacterium]|nr:ornithine carbamoyltransferase [Chloroflexota bacterium]